jgi:hypothetical protein
MTSMQLPPIEKDWERTESADAAFTVSFPGHPAASTQKETDAIDGTEFLANRLEVSPAPRINYAVSWWVNPQQTNKPTEELFAHFRDCDAKIFRAKAGTREFIVQGYPAIGIVVLSPEAIVYNRVIRAGPRMYSLWVVDTSRTFVAEQGNAKQFLDSFSLRQQ